MRTTRRGLLATISAAALLLGLAGCAGSDTATSPAQSEPTQSAAQSAEEAADEGGFVGDWIMVAMADEAISEEDIDFATDWGVSMTLELNEDQSARFTIGNQYDLGTWKATSETEGVYEGDAQQADLRIEDGRLFFIQEESTMIMERADLTEVREARETAATDAEAEAEQEAAVDGARQTVADTDLVTVSLIGTAVTGSGHPGYVFEVKNNSDKKILLSASPGDVTIGGQPAEAVIHEVLKPGEEGTALLFFDSDALGTSEVSALQEVVAGIKVRDDDSLDVLEILELQLPAGDTLPTAEY